MELLQTLRKIRACEGDAAAQLLLEAYVAQAVAAERERCATICDELESIWTALKDAALLNGDVSLSNAQSGEPRAARAIKAQILGA